MTWPQYCRMRSHADNVPRAGQPTLTFSVLGQLHASIDGRDIQLGPRKRQVVFATLLASPGRLVPVDVLVDTVWGGDPPPTARKNIHGYVHGLRTALRRAGAHDCIVSRDRGYLLSADPPVDIDSVLFEKLARTGADATGQASRGEPGGGQSAGLRAALDLWRGPAFEGLDGAPLIAAEADRLSKRYVAVFEAWAESALATDRSAVLDQIDAVIRLDPFRERLRMIHMTALQREARTSEALAVFAEYRQFLARELGQRPSAAITRLHEQVLLDGPSSSTGSAQRGNEDRVQHVSGPSARRVAPDTLPHLTRFTGRRSELVQLTTLLREHGERAVIISGGIGTGKTALAVRCGQQLRGAFPDGRLFLSLRGPDGSPRSVRAILRELVTLADAATHRSEAHTENLALRWRAWASTHHALIIADDVPDESTARLLLANMGRSALILTSRARLSGLCQTTRVCLSPLRLDEAVELLGQHIGADRVAADATGARCVVLAADLLPLSIATAAGKLAGLPHLPLTEYARRLAEAPSVLDELHAGASCVRSRITAALRNLPAADRRTLGLLGGLRQAQFTLGQAMSVLGTDIRSASLSLERLIEANIVMCPRNEVSAVEASYEIPALLFAYAVEQAGAVEQARG